MKKILLLLILCCGICGCGNTDDPYLTAEKYIATQQRNTYEPVTRPDGGKFRICVLSSDNNYTPGALMYYAVEKLRSDGFIELDEELPFSPENTNLEELIDYLSEKDTGSYIGFTDFLYIDRGGNEDYKDRLDSLISENKIDILICTGTDPGLVGKKISRGRIPVLVTFSTDPVAAGITNYSERSGIRNLWAHIESSGYKNQLMLYRSIYSFKNLGMVYYNEAAAGLAEFENAAKDMGISVSALKMVDNAFSAKDSEEYYREYKAKILTLAEDYDIDAFMINSSMTDNEERAEEICDMLMEMGIPVFGQSGDEFTKKGSPLMSVTYHPREDAAFLADTLEGITNGRRCEEMPQIYDSPLHISVNKTAADKLNITLDYDTLKYADKVYY